MSQAKSMSAAATEHRHRIKRAECTGASASRQGKTPEFRPKTTPSPARMRKHFDNKGFFA
jgi:hypothetical protein